MVLNIHKIIGYSTDNLTYLVKTTSFQVYVIVNKKVSSMRKIMMPTAY